jgi:predicted MFS family arabinose efflux permease
MVALPARFSPCAQIGLSAYWLAWVASILFFAGFYALLVPLSRYLVRIGLQDWQIGFVLGAFGIAALVGRPLSGLVVDRFGAQATMLVGAGSLAAGALGVSATESVDVLLGLRVLQAIGYVAFTTASTALVVSLVAPESRAGRLAAFGAAANIAIALAPAAVTAMLGFAPLETGLLASAALACVAGVLAASLSFASTGDGSARPKGLELFAPSRAWLPMLVTGLLGAGFAAFFQFAPILADRRGVPPGLLYTIYGAAIIATRFAAGRLLDRLDVARVVVPAALSMALAYGLIAQGGDSFALLVLGVGLVALSGGLFHPALLAHHAVLLPDAPGRASAAFYVAFDLGIGLGSWVFGGVLQLAGLSGLYWAAAALATAAVPLASRLALRR